MATLGDAVFFFVIGVVTIIAVILLWLDWRAERKAERENRYEQHRKEQLAQLASQYRRVPHSFERGLHEVPDARRGTRH